MPSLRWFSVAGSGMMACLREREAPKSLRIWLHDAVRSPTNRSRTRCSAWPSCCSTVLIATKRIVGRSTASQIGSASLRSFLFDFTDGLTKCGLINRPS